MVSKSEFHQLASVCEGEVKVPSKDWAEEVYPFFTKMLAKEDSPLTCAFQPVRLGDMVHHAELLLRGISTQQHAAPGPLFPYIAKNSSAEELSAWKMYEVECAVQASQHFKIPISINFVPADITDEILEKVRDQKIIAELLEKHNWSVELVGKIAKFFHAVHADDTNKDTWNTYNPLIVQGLINAMKVDIKECVVAFRVEVRATPHSNPNPFFLSLLDDFSEEVSRRCHMDLFQRIADLLSNHTEMCVILEVTVPNEAITNGLREYGFSPELADRILVQGGETCAMAYVPKMDHGSTCLQRSTGNH